MGDHPGKTGKTGGSPVPANAAELFPGSAATMQLLRSTNWGETELGPVAQWPTELVSAVRLVMPARMPMQIWWGPGLIQLYNDDYAQLVGNNHPAAMGQPAKQCWAEVWDDLAPFAAQAMAGGSAWAENKLLLLDRHGYLEETYWTVSYSPIRSAAGDEIMGVLVASTDVTDRVVGERRLETVRQLGVLSAASTGSAVEVCKAAAEVLSSNRQAVPFAAMYLVEPDESSAQLVASYGIGTGTAITPAQSIVVGDSSPVGKVAASGIRTLVTGLNETAAQGAFVRGPLGPLLPEAAMLVPVTIPGQAHPAVVAALGVNPYRAVDDVYLIFFELVARQLRVALTDAVAYEYQRLRAVALTELDEDKTRFYQDVSHEFRTPLTLILGPLRSVLEGSESGLSEADRESLLIARRAALRLSKLVNGLLSFSHAEADQVHAQYEKTDLASLTADLASMFRSLVEQAGLDYVIDVSGVSEPVDVDREMWAEIVLNLLSNAVKFTRQGQIKVTLSEAGERMVLTVSDTGTGIPAEQLDSVFDRFTQVPGRSGRSGEGAGIGLALVRALVAAHAGEVSAESTEGEGTTFIVSLPTAASPASMAAPLAEPTGLSIAEAYVAEAEPWVASMAPDPVPPVPTAPIGRLLLVEDNADMRSYLTRLLAADGWLVDAVNDVEAALRVDPPPDLVLSDVMLPGRSGLDLVRMLRADPLLPRCPVILLTARAGSDSTAQALRLGADDYLVKPFDPAELLARVRVHHELTRLRDYALSQAEERAGNLRQALASNRQIGMAMGVLMAQDVISEDEAFARLRTASQTMNRKLRDVADEVVLTGALPDSAGHTG